MPIDLGGFPAGGIWSGAGVNGGLFDPSVAGVGTHRICYQYKDANGCASVDSTTIVVSGIPTLYTGSYGPLCVNASPVFLSATPEGGSWSGTSVAGNTFDPSEAGVGKHPVTYQLSIVGGCTADTTITIEVMPLPFLALGSYGPLCAEHESVSLSAIPSGGMWSGTGVGDTLFNPAVAGVGTHILTYYFADIFGCSSLKEVSVQVNPCIDINDCALIQCYHVSMDDLCCDEGSLFSNTIPISKELQVNVFPNPFGTTLNVSIKTPEKTKVLVELFDLQGKLLRRVYVGELQSQESRQLQLAAPLTAAPIMYRVTTSKKVFSGVLLPSN
jgi:hypothetical protein